MKLPCVDCRAEVVVDDGVRAQLFGFNRILERRGETPLLLEDHVKCRADYLRWRAQQYAGLDHERRLAATVCRMIDEDKEPEPHDVREALRGAFRPTVIDALHRKGRLRPEHHQ